MTRGKQTCKILKDIRRRIAEANDIEFVTSECRYKGDCPGSCPRCEAEVRYLEQQLRTRRLAGKAVALAGISLGALSLVAPTPSTAQTPQDRPEAAGERVVLAAQIVRVTVKGRVCAAAPDHAEGKQEAAAGAIVRNLNTDESVSTDMDGYFEIGACRGDSIAFSYIGCEPQSRAVTDASDSLNVALPLQEAILGEIAPMGIVPAPRDRDHMLDLRIVDRNGGPVDPYGIRIERICPDEDGKGDCEELNPAAVEEKGLLRLYWDHEAGLQDEDGEPLKKATLRIEAVGYDEPVTVEVKYPKRSTRKTVRFKSPGK